MPNLRSFVPLLFVPAIIGILRDAFLAQSLPEQLLSLALLLLCLDLARMAKVDLDNTATVSAQFLEAELPEDARLESFRKTVLSTIVLELLGFYGVLLSLQWGGIVVIFSQLWFNLLAKVHLCPQKSSSVTHLGLLGRLPVLLANAGGLSLLACWSVLEIRFWLALSLLLLVGFFLIVKYAGSVFSRTAEQNAAKPLVDRSSGSE